MEKKFINSRIRELRKHLKLSQTEFGERIGLKASAISKIEQDGSTVVEQNIKLICEKFNVSRGWLVDGEGEMFAKGTGSFEVFARDHKLTGPEQRLARYLLTLPESERRDILRHISAMAAAIAGPDEEDAGADETAALHRQLDEELAKEKTAASASSSGSSATAAQ